MTEKEYRQHPAISRSELWHMHESPEKFKWYRDHPPEPTPSLLFGHVVHKLLLQPDTFDTEFAIAPELDRRTKKPTMRSVTVWGSVVLYHLICTCKP